MSYPRTWQVPERPLQFLIGGLVNDTAHNMLMLPNAPDNVLHPGDPYGLVLAWLWKTDRAHAIAFIADLLAQLREWDERSTRSITLDALLDGIPFALQGLTPDEEQELIGQARREVPEHFHKDVNSRE